MDFSLKQEMEYIKQKGFVLHIVSIKEDKRGVNNDLRRNDIQQ